MEEICQSQESVNELFCTREEKFLKSDPTTSVLFSLSSIDDIQNVKNFSGMRRAFQQKITLTKDVYEGNLSEREEETGVVTWSIFP